MNLARHAVLLLVVAMPWLTVVAVAMDQNASETRREIVDISAYPWASIGKIGISGHSVATTCTGSVIGPKQILTAAHCLYTKTTTRLVSADEIHFLLGYEKGQYRAHRVGSRYVISPKFNFANVLAGEAGEDWAVLYIDEPFPRDTRPLRLAAERPLLGTLLQIAGYANPKGHMMTADKHCRVKAVSADGKLITHNCIVHHGDSGGPLLETKTPKI